MEDVYMHTKTWEWERLACFSFFLHSTQIHGMLRSLEQYRDSLDKGLFGVNGLNQKGCLNDLPLTPPVIDTLNTVMAGELELQLRGSFFLGFSCSLVFN